MWRFVMFSLLLLAAVPVRAQPPATDFAIMDPYVASSDGRKPTFEEVGVSPAEIRALHQMLRRFGWTFQGLTFDQINLRGPQCLLRSDGSANFKALICPGGRMRGREDAITAAGNDNIRKLISDGGGYIGFCGGAFEGVETMMWARYPRTAGTFHVRGDYHRTHPGLDLFPGEGWGPLAWVPTQLETTLEPTRMNLDVPALRQAGVASYTEIPYAGGPVLSVRTPPKDYEVWGWSQVPDRFAGRSFFGANWPSIVHFSYGSGQVVLIAHHPVMIPGGQINGVQVEKPIKGWQHLVATVSPEQLNRDNYQSWNLLHAAFQVLLREAPSPMVIR